jgi:hypothetical protein
MAHSKKNHDYEDVMREQALEAPTEIYSEDREHMYLATPRSRPGIRTLEMLGGTLALLQIMMLVAVGLQWMKWHWWLVLSPAIVWCSLAAGAAIIGFARCALDARRL